MVALSSTTMTVSLPLICGTFSISLSDLHDFTTPLLSHTHISIKLFQKFPSNYELRAGRLVDIEYSSLFQYCVTATIVPQKLCRPYFWQVSVHYSRERMLSSVIVSGGVSFSEDWSTTFKAKNGWTQQKKNLCTNILGYNKSKKNSTNVELTVCIRNASFAQLYYFTEIVNFQIGTGKRNPCWSSFWSSSFVGCFILLLGNKLNEP